MPQEVLYRKYRPQKLEEILGQNHVTKTLSSAFSKQRISHAYLLTGPRGTGKTSIARIIAKSVNCCSPGRNLEPCGKCQICLGVVKGSFVDLIEIDAASNRGIDEIRDLRSKVHLAPAHGRRKVYIIDEVHMLTKEAFNALLKTLEEPPPHAVFVLATTEPHKLPATVVSRCQRFDFKRAEISKIVERLEKLCELEKVGFEKEALELIASSAEGAFRDADVLLDKVIGLLGGKKITQEIIQEILGLSGFSLINEFVEEILLKDVTASLNKINEILEKGGDLSQFSKGVILHLRKLLAVKTLVEDKFLQLTPEVRKIMEKQANLLNPGQLSFLIKLFIQADQTTKISPISQLPLELATIEAIEYLERNLEESGNNKIEENTGVQKTDSTKVDNFSKSANISDESLMEIGDLWPNILAGVKGKNHSVEALLKGCRPRGYDGKQVVLEFFYPFHKERIESPRSRSLVESQLKEVLGKPVKIRCVLGEKEKDGGEKKDLVDLAEEIFSN